MSSHMLYRYRPGSTKDKSTHRAVEKFLVKYRKLYYICALKKYGSIPRHQYNRALYGAYIIKSYYH